MSVQVSSSTCSSEEMLLGRAIATFHNAVRPRETPVTEQEARHWNHMCIFRLYNVRTLPLKVRGWQTKKPGANCRLTISRQQLLGWSLGGTALLPPDTVTSSHMLHGLPTVEWLLNLFHRGMRVGGVAGLQQ